MRTILMAFCVTAAISAWGLMATVESNVVGYMASEIKKGKNEVSVRMDSLDIFPTLDRVIEFSPAENVIGDVLVYDLDGVRRRYVFECWTGSNYVLRAQSRQLPPEIGLDWIPLRKKFWIDHVSTNSLSIVNSGEARLRQTSLEMDKKVSIEVRIVDGKEGERGLFESEN